MKTILFAILIASLAPFARAGANVYSNTSGLTATAVLVSATPASLSGYNVQNPNGVAIFLQFFNVTSAGSVTVGTTPPFFVLAVPGNGVLDGPTVVPPTFNKGVVVAATTTASGSSAPATALPATFFTN